LKKEDTIRDLINKINSFNPHYEEKDEDLSRKRLVNP